MLRTCKKTLDIAIFTLTNDKIFAAIEETWNRGVEVRIITDDECCKHIGSDIYKLAADVRFFINFRVSLLKLMMIRNIICIINLLL